MTPKIKTWVTFDETLKFGEGRARLLELIEQYGSLQRAANALGMSYRNAWGYLGELEGAAGLKFVERAPGGAPRSGMRLTNEAKQFLGRYWKFRAAVERSAQRHFARAFGPPGMSRGTRRKSTAVRRPPKARG